MACFMRRRGWLYLTASYWLAARVDAAYSTNSPGTIVQDVLNCESVQKTTLSCWQRLLLFATRLTSTPSAKKCMVQCSVYRVVSIHNYLQTGLCLLFVMYRYKNCPVRQTHVHFAIIYSKRLSIVDCLIIYCTRYEFEFGSSMLLYIGSLVNNVGILSFGEIKHFDVMPNLLCLVKVCWWTSRVCFCSVLCVRRQWDVIMWLCDIVFGCCRLL